MFANTYLCIYTRMCNLPNSIFMLKKLFDMKKRRIFIIQLREINFWNKEKYSNDLKAKKMFNISHRKF